MGKRLQTQARGKGGPRYRASSHNWFGAISYPKPSESAIRGEVLDIVHCPGHSTPLAVIKFENNEIILIAAPLGLQKGAIVWSGPGSPLSLGCIIPIEDIPSGYPICNLERIPFNGPELIRASGSSATIIGKEAGKVIVKLPSRRTIALDPKCRATIGVLAGGGRTEKPWVKAGKRYLALKAKGGKVFPKVSGVAQNAIDHPFGGTHRRSLGIPRTTRKWGIPPGRKVGLLGARRTGKAKR